MTFVKRNVFWVLTASLIVPSVGWATDGASPQVRSDHRSKDIKITTEADAIDLSGREVGVSVSGVKTSKGTKATRVKAHIKAPLFINGSYHSRQESGFKLFEGASAEVDYNGSKIQSHKIQVQGPAALEVKGFNRNAKLGNTLGLTEDQIDQLSRATIQHASDLSSFLGIDEELKRQQTETPNLDKICNEIPKQDVCDQYRKTGLIWHERKENLDQAKAELKMIALRAGLKIDPEKYKKACNTCAPITEAEQFMQEILPNSVKADSTGQITAMQLGFQTEKDPESGLQQTIGTLDGLNMGGHTAFKIGGFPLHVGGNLGGGAFFGKSKFARTTQYFGGQAEGRAFVGVRAPKLGEINYGADVGWQYGVADSKDAHGDASRMNAHLLKAGHEISIESAPIGGVVRAGVVGRKETTRSYRNNDTLADKKDTTIVGVSVRGAFE